MLRGQPLRVAVFSPHLLTRAGLAVLLRAANGRVVYLPGTEDPLPDADVAIYDLAGLAKPDGTQVHDLLAKGLPVVGLARDARPDLSEHALRWGVSAVIPVSVTPDRLVAVLETAASGKWQSSTDTLAEQKRLAGAGLGLTGRELDILELIANGHSNLELADVLGVSVNTIKSGIRSLYRKIGVTNRTQSIRWALNHGIGAPTPP